MEIHAPLFFMQDILHPILLCLQDFTAPKYPSFVHIQSMKLTSIIDLYQTFISAVERCGFLTNSMNFKSSFPHTWINGNFLRIFQKFIPPRLDLLCWKTCPLTNSMDFKSSFPWACWISEMHIHHRSDSTFDLGHWKIQVLPHSADPINLFHSRKLKQRNSSWA